MCGFGDKDRRPITPPPCVRLIVRDEATGRDIDISEIDVTYFLLSVDLWTPDGKTEVNLVRHSANSPSISATTAASYPPASTPLHHYNQPPNVQPVHGGMPNTMYGQPPHPPNYYGHPPQEGYPQHGAPGQPMPDGRQPYYPPQQSPMGAPPGYGDMGRNGVPQQMIAPPMPVMVTQDPRSAPSGMFTRNLIGSLCVSAFKLTDPNNHVGIWFILQDLSVRTEGQFRLKFSFVDVGSRTSPNQLNTSSAPVLATCYSDVFQVFSAKRFPGVIESTALSKCFATQGIKIPIRKEGNGRANEDDE